MSGSRGVVLLETPAGWQVMPAGGRDEFALTIAATDAATIAEETAKFVAEHKLRTDRVLIALSSSSTVFVSFPAADLAGSRDRQTMTYRLEDALPLDAEQIVADFQTKTDPVTAVAVNADALIDLVDACEQMGLRVQSIVSASLVALDEWLTKSNFGIDQTVVWAHDGHADIFAFVGRSLSDWRHYPVGQVAASLRMDDAESDVTVVDAAPEFVDALRPINRPIESVSSVGRTALVRAGASRILAGRQSPRYELRRERLASGDPYRGFKSTTAWLALAACCLVASVVGACLWKSHQFTQRLADVKDEQRTLYQRAFDTDEMPRAVMSRLKSEHAKVLASRRGTADVPTVTSALDVLYDFLSGMPQGVRSRTTKLVIDDNDLTVVVTLNSHSAAGELAASLEEVGFMVTPPGTIQQEDATISSTLQAEWSPPTTDDSATTGETQPVSTSTLSDAASNTAEAG